MTVLQPSQDYGSVAHKVWPWAMVRGALAVIFGILAFAWLLPTAAMTTFAMTIGIFAILDGLANGVESTRRRQWQMALRGVAALVGIAFGVFALVMADMSSTTMVWAVGVWAFVIGALELVTNLLDRGSDHRDWVFGMIMGALAIVFGVVAVITMPELTTMIILAAVATILWGVAALIMGGTERRMARNH